MVSTAQADAARYLATMAQARRMASGLLPVRSDDQTGPTVRSDDQTQGSPVTSYAMRRRVAHGRTWLNGRRKFSDERGKPREVKGPGMVARMVDGPHGVPLPMYQGPAYFRPMAQKTFLDKRNAPIGKRPV